MPLDNVPSDSELQKKYPEDFKCLTSLLGDAGIVLGDAIKITMKNEGTYCGFYVQNDYADTSVAYNAKTGQYGFGGGGITIHTSACSLEQHKSTVKAVIAAQKKYRDKPYSFTSPPGMPETNHFFVSDIKSLEKLIPKKMTG